MLKNYTLFLGFYFSLTATLTGFISILFSNAINELQTITLIGGLLCTYSFFVAIILEPKSGGN